MSTFLGTLPAMLKAPFVKRLGIRPNPANLIDSAYDNGFIRRWRNAAGTGTVDGIGVDSGNTLHLGGAPVVKPAYQHLYFRAPANADITTRRFHIFGAAGRIISIEEIHTTAGNDSGAVTGHVTKESSGQAPGTGVSLMSGTFNLKGTANTLQSATLASNGRYLEFAENDSLSFKLTGTATTAAGICLRVTVQYYTAVFEQSIYLAAGTQDQGFFIANRPYEVLGIRYSHQTKEVTATTMAVQVKIQDGTETSSQGTAILTNNSNAGFSAVAANDAVQTGTFAALTMAASERLSVDFSTSGTELVGLVVTVTFRAQANRLEVSYWRHDTDVVDAVYFIADRDYELYDGRQKHAVAAGGTSTANVEKVSGTNNPSTGTALLATAWDLNATAETIQVADISTVKATRLIVDGERLSIDYGHTEQSMVGMLQTLSLIGV